ncbi:MAG TPA: hypothetical protein VH142_24310, partial [Polyangiaceae bacterium]|nr:hypothetical protein [Polyangiaceae bacterium]
LVCAVLLVLFLFRGRRKRGTDGEWGALLTCVACGGEVPRWFMTDMGSPRGPVSRYPYSIPRSCRRCRHTKGAKPAPWNAGETELQYDARSERAFADALGMRR